MPEYKLYCFAQSGNAYRAALMLNLIGAKWEPIWVDFFKAGETRTPKYREEVNEMGEAPVLVDGKKKLSQSGVIITYLAEKSGKFLPQGDDERLEALRWMIFDNQKINGFLAPYRFLKNWAKGVDPAVADKGRDGHPGLQGMRERAARIGGKLPLASSSNSGTETKLVVPGGIIFRKTMPARRSPFTRMRTLFR